MIMPVNSLVSQLFSKFMINSPNEIAWLATMDCVARGQRNIDEIEALADSLFTLMPMVVAHINERLEELDLTNTDIAALRSIEGPMPMKDLAQCMSYDPSYVTVVADRLEGLGLIERQPHPSDRRIKNLVLTEQGKQLRKGLPERLWSGDSIFSALTAQEREQLVELASRMIARQTHP